MSTAKDCTGVDPMPGPVATGENTRSADACSVATTTGAVGVRTEGTVAHAMNAMLATVNATDRSTESDTPEGRW